MNDLSSAAASDAQLIQPLAAAHYLNENRIFHGFELLSLAEQNFLVAELLGFCKSRREQQQRVKGGFRLALQAALNELIWRELPLEAAALLHHTILTAQRRSGGNALKAFRPTQLLVEYFCYENRKCADLPRVHCRTNPVFAVLLGDDSVFTVSATAFERECRFLIKSGDAMVIQAPLSEPLGLLETAPRSSRLLERGGSLSIFLT